jgi:hypothetical protein
MVCTAGAPRQIRPGDVDAAHRNRIIATGSIKSFCRSEIMAAAPAFNRARSSCVFMVKIILPSGLRRGQSSSRTAAFGTTGFSTCPHRKHSKRASILTMFMPHCGRAAGLQSKSMYRSMLGGSFCSFRREARVKVLKLPVTIAMQCSARWISSVL